jgi:hypothetical protein
MALFARAVDAVMRDAGVARDARGTQHGHAGLREFYRQHPEKTISGWIPARYAGRGPPPPYRGPGTRSNSEKFADFMIPAVGAARGGEAIMTKTRRSASRSKTPIRPTSADTILAASSILARASRWPADYEAFVRRLAPRPSTTSSTEPGRALPDAEAREFNAILSDFLDGVRGGPARP